MTARPPWTSSGVDTNVWNELHSVEIGDVVLVHRTDRQRQRPPRPFCRNFHFTPEPEHAVVIFPHLIPTVRKHHPLPAGIIEAGIRPAPADTIVLRAADRLDNLHQFVVLRGIDVAVAGSAPAFRMEHLRFKLQHHIAEIGILHQSFPAAPRHRIRTAPRGVDYPHRHSGRLRHFAGEVECRSGKHSAVSVPRPHPAGVKLRPSTGPRAVRNVQHADIFRLLRLQRFCRTYGTERHLHIRLPGGQPHFADHDFPQDTALTTADQLRLQHERPARLAG